MWHGRLDIEFSFSCLVISFLAFNARDGAVSDIVWLGYKRRNELSYCVWEIKKKIAGQKKKEEEKAGLKQFRDPREGGYTLAMKKVRWRVSSVIDLFLSLFLFSFLFSFASADSHIHNRLMAKFALDSTKIYVMKLLSLLWGRWEFWRATLLSIIFFLSFFCFDFLWNVS